MVARRLILLAAAVSFSLATFSMPAFSRAQDAPGTSEVENAKQNFIGAINGTSVFVRSSPREDAYPTMKLDKGQQVTVVGIKFKWLKILPPEGSFAYVPKAYINKRGDGKLGRATREVIAKVGSSLNQLKTAPMAKIDEGQDVEITGEQDEYYTIKPPEGTFLYVNESFVDPVQRVAVAVPKAHDPAPKPGPEVVGAPPVVLKADPTTNESDPKIVRTETPVGGTDAVPTTQPVETVVAPVAPDTFAKLEADFRDAGEKPITDQPIDSLLSGYGDLLKQDALTPRMRQISEVRVSTLKLRAQAKAEFLALRNTQIQAADRQKALVAERDEIQQRIKDKQVTFYTAVGTLRASSIQRGSGTLFRLTDPASFRTVAYIRSDDAGLAKLLGQFIGIKGTLTTDAALNMKIIEQPNGAEAIDPAKVNDTIAAQIIPPSMVPKLPTARAAD